MIIFAVASPGTWRHVTYFDELPVGHVCWCEAEIIADGWGNIQACSMIAVRFWPLISKDVLKMVSAKWAAILPLRITSYDCLCE